MSQKLTPVGKPDQTLIELILALKALVQTFDIAHGNLRALIESEARLSARELERIRDLVDKNNQAVSLLPVVLSDRVEKLLEHLEKDLDKKLEGMIREVTVSVTQVHEKFVLYVQAKGEPHSHEATDSKDVTGRLELHRDGQVDVRFQSAWAQRLIAGLKWTAIGGGSYGIVELLRKITGL